MSIPHVYAWAKKRGFFGRTGEISHLLLDKGVLCVTDTADNEFVQEYSIGVVSGGKPPCIVEYKTKVFRMFYDLDILTTAEIATSMTLGQFSPVIKNFFYTVCENTAVLFDINKTVVTVCISNVPKKTANGVKVGVHVTFDNIYVTSPTALFVREQVIEKLTYEENPFINAWDSIVDISVFKGSGMRLPWSAKFGEPNRVYVPVMTYTLDREESGVVETEIKNAEVVKSVSAVRKIISQVCLRSRQQATKLSPKVKVDLDVNDTSPSHSGSFSHPSLKQFAAVIEELSKHIPEVYGGNVSGVIRTENAYMFRHTSRYCANVEREHHSSNCYFLVSKAGMRQCCYSRKDDDVGRKYCLCSQFRGDLITLPKKMIEELFPKTEEDIKNEAIVKLPSPIPSVAAKNYSSIDNVVSRATAPTKRKPTMKQSKQTKKHVYYPGSVLTNMFGNTTTIRC